MLQTYLGYNIITLHLIKDINKQYFRESWLKEGRFKSFTTATLIKILKKETLITKSNRNQP